MRKLLLLPLLLIGLITTTEAQMQGAVTISTFTVQQSGQDLVFNWTATPQEYNTQFEIWYSSDGVNWTGPIHTQAGEQYSTTAMNYTWTDAGPHPNATHYFQLRFKDDFANTFDLSSQSVTYTVSSVVNVESRKAALDIYPNPMVNEATVSFDFPLQEDMQIIIYDLLGSRIYTSDFLMSNEVRIQRGELKNGLYILRLMNSNGILATKQLIVR